MAEMKAKPTEPVMVFQWHILHSKLLTEQSM